MVFSKGQQVMVTTKGDKKRPAVVNYHSQAARTVSVNFTDVAKWVHLPNSVMEANVRALETARAEGLVRVKLFTTSASDPLVEELQAENAKLKRKIKELSLMVDEGIAKLQRVESEESGESGCERV
ncbi:MAG: hypothetical protein ACKVI4_17605 [Actinomycetales bacterium]